MGDFKDYFILPEGFKTDYVKAVYRGFYPLLFLVSIVMMTTGIFVIGEGTWQMLRSKKTVTPPIKRMLIGFGLLILGVLYSRWYIIVFYPETVLGEILS